MLRSLHLASPDRHLGFSSNIRSWDVLETVSSHLDQESEEIKDYYFPPSYPVFLFVCLFVLFFSINHPLSSFFYCLFLWVLSFLKSSSTVKFSSVQSLSHVRLFAAPWTAACQASLSITNSWSLPKLMSIESVMPSNHLILCCPLLLPSIFPSSSVFSNESSIVMTHKCVHLTWNSPLSLRVVPTCLLGSVAGKFHSHLYLSCRTVELRTILPHSLSDRSGDSWFQAAVGAFLAWG